MVIAALICFAILLVAWILAPDGQNDPRSEPRPMPRPSERLSRSPPSARARDAIPVGRATDECSGQTDNQVGRTRTNGPI